jgi:hypothetical protein
MIWLRGLLPYIAIAVVAGGVAFMTGRDMGQARAERDHRQERMIWLRREVTLWNELGNERRSKLELIEEVETIVNATGRARSRMLEELDRTKARAVQAEEQAQDAIRRLGDVEDTWKDERVPDAVVCVFDDAACTVTPAPGAYRDDAVAVRE